MTHPLSELPGPEALPSSVNTTRVRHGSGGARHRDQVWGPDLCLALFGRPHLTPRVRAILIDYKLKTVLPI